MATETTVDVVMPQMGVSVSEGTITKWLKQEGEPIEADEPLLEISTDKVDTEVPSPGTGVVAQILVPEGETVEVGAKLAVIAPEGAEVAAEGEPAAPPQVEEPATAEPAAEAAEAAPAETAPPSAETVSEAAPAPEREAPPEPSPDGKTFVSPVVARIAAEHGVDPNQVEGTGRGGRVTKKDILAFIESGGPASMKAREEEAAVEPTAPPRDVRTEPAPAPAPKPAAPAAVPSRAEPEAPLAEPAPGEQLEPMTAMRRGI